MFVILFKDSYEMVLKKSMVYVLRLGVVNNGMSGKNYEDLKWC